MIVGQADFPHDWNGPRDTHEIDPEDERRAVCGYQPIAWKTIVRTLDGVVTPTCGKCTDADYLEQRRALYGRQ